MSNNPSVFIIILNYNGLEFNIPCIDSILSQDTDEITVVFVDNGSTDGSLEACKEKYGNSLIYIENNENLFFAAGNNIGIRYALESGADYVFILNNDTICSATDCIRTLTDFMAKNPNVGACQPLLVEMNNVDRISSAGCVVSFSGRAWDANLGEAVSSLSPSPLQIHGVTGGAMFLRSEALKKVGLFDESYQMYFEDIELSFRLTLAGYDLYVVPTTHIQHLVAGSSSKAGALRVFFCERNAYRLVGTYFPRKTRWASLLLNLIFFAPAAALLNLIRSRPTCSLAILKAMREGTIPVDNPNRSP